YRTNIKNRKNTQGTPLVPLHYPLSKMHRPDAFEIVYDQRQPKPLAKGNPKLKLYYIIEGLGAHLAKGNPKRKL
ncbi:hypothetical protein L208DRAFT_1322011, partial [Tricholoma matsutake]